MVFDDGSLYAEGENVSFAIQDRDFFKYIKCHGYVVGRHHETHIRPIKCLHISAIGCRCPVKIVQILDIQLGPTDTLLCPS